MIWLAIGVLLWSGVHLFPCLAVEPRKRLIDRMGDQPYKGVFALSLVVAIVLMVLGWRSTVPHAVYTPPAWSAPAANLLMVVALALFVASAVPSNLKRVIRHPQLTGFGLWAGAHLLANGDRRSLLLFGGLGLWAVLAILFINRRDGAWLKPDPLPMTAEVKLVAITIVAFAVLFLTHPWLSGVTPLPR